MGLSESPGPLARFNSLESPRDVAPLVGLTWPQLTFLLYRRGPASYYKRWTIRKRGGGTREIQAPTSTLYRIQRILCDLLQDAYQPRPATHGFVRGRSVATNAKGHIGKRYVLNFDIEDFFPTIHFGRVRGLFLATPFKCPPDVATVLAQICCSRGALPIGAPTSPVIANMICLRLDKDLQMFAKQHGCWYSRYADDLTFSSDRNRFPTAVAEVVDDEVHLSESLVRILRENGFRPNPRKTRLQTWQDRQLVTGVVVNKLANVDRRYIRRVRAMLHSWQKYGLENAQSHVAKYDTKDRYPGAAPSFLNILRGRIAYLAMVRGSDDWLAARFADQFDNLVAKRDLHHGIDYNVERFIVAPPKARPQRRVLTIMFTDIVGSTTRLAMLGDRKGGELQEKHDQLIRKHVARHAGKEI